MRYLVNSKGVIEFGQYEDTVDDINYLDYNLKTPMGSSVPRFIKKMKFNQFIFIGISGETIMAGMAIVDLKYITNGFFYIYDKKNDLIFGTTKLSLPKKDIYITSSPDACRGHFKTGDFIIDFDSPYI